MSPSLDLAPLLVAENLTKSFRVRGRESVAAVRNASLEVTRGSTLGIVGETGSGKSTLGRMLLAMIRPDSGSVVFEGQAVSDLRRSSLRGFRQRAQMVFQDPYDSLDPRMRIGESITEPLLPARVSRARRRERLGEALERVGLGPEFARRYPHQLSGGQRQRVGIARALITRPSLLVLDEPVSALDVSVQAQILNLLNGLQQELGLTYVFISHDLSVVRNISDRVAVMSQGEIIEAGSVERIYEETEHPYTQRLLSAVPIRHPRDRRRRRVGVLGDDGAAT